MRNLAPLSLSLSLKLLITKISLNVRFVFLKNELITDKEKIVNFLFGCLQHCQTALISLTAFFCDWILLQNAFRGTG